MEKNEIENGEFKIGIKELSKIKIEEWIKFDLALNEGRKTSKKLFFIFLMKLKKLQSKY